MEAVDEGVLRERLGKAIKLLLAQRGLRPTNAARELGNDPSTWTRVANGESFPSIPGLYRLADLIGVPVGRFFDVADRIDEPETAAEVAESVTRNASPTASPSKNDELAATAERGFVALAEIIRKFRDGQI